MIVKYTIERNYNGIGKDPHLILGKEYLVFGIKFLPEEHSPQNEIILQRDQDGMLSLFDISFFSIIDQRIPNDWHLKVSDKNYFRLEPLEFAGDFWDLYYEGDQLTENIFADVKKKIRKFHDTNHV